MHHMYNKGAVTIYLDTTESVDEFYTRCRVLALKCKFNDRDDRLIDQLIIGTRVSDSRKARLRENENLTVDDALKECRTHEASEAHMKAFEKVGVAGPRADVIQKGHGDKKSKQVTDCKFCGKDHLYGKCPAFHTKCSHCGRMGHWKVRCLQVRGQDDSQEGRYRHSKFSRKKDGGGNRRVHAVDVEPGEACEKLSFDAIHSSTKASVDNEDIMVHVDVKIPDCNRPAEMLCKVDTGPQGNVLPLRTFRKMFPSLVSGPELKYGQVVVKRPHVRLYGYGGSEITQFGSVKLRICYPKLNKQWHEAEFFIVDTTGPIVLGKHDVCIMLKIITVNTVARMTLRVSDASFVGKQTKFNDFPERKHQWVLMNGSM